MIKELAACFAGLDDPREALDDPREARKCDHQLIDILVIAVCAVIGCAESGNDIALYDRSKKVWLKTFLALPNGIPRYLPAGVHAHRPGHFRGPLRGLDPLAWGSH